MGKENETQSGFSETTSLIDFLYVDEARVDSLISQLRNGTLRSVTKTVGTSEGSSVSGKAGMPPLLGGQYLHKTETDESAAENYDPYHNKIIQLLQDLALPVKEAVEGGYTGRLVNLKGKVKIRDIKSIKSLIPIMMKNRKTFGITGDIAPTLKGMGDLIQAFEDSIDLTVELTNQIKISGSLKEQGLSIRQSDLARTYGVELPGDWYVMGILDSNTLSSKTNTQKMGQSIETLIEQYTDAVQMLYAQAPYSIIPILIFREIH